MAAGAIKAARGGWLGMAGGLQGASKGLSGEEEGVRGGGGERHRECRANCLSTRRAKQPPMLQSSSTPRCHESKGLYDEEFGHTDEDRQV